MKNTILLLLLAVASSYAHAQPRYAIIIHEIMADPSPEVGLPGNEWVELYNRSAAAVNLRGWRLGDAAGESGMMPNFILQPGAYVIVCTGSAVGAMSSFGNTISVTSFPSLGNDGDLVYIKSPDGNIVHAVQYETSWYGNTLKQEGGWTLEMIDTDKPCLAAANWTASQHERGGTPGAANAVKQSLADEDAPAVTHAYTINPLTIIVVFNEAIDSLTASDANHYHLQNGPAVLSATSLPPLFKEVRITLQEPLQDQRIYTIIMDALSDCAGNRSPAQEVHTGLPVVAAAHEVVINEILFNPRPDGYDYVELYNRSSKIVDIADLHLANRSSAGAVASITRISQSPRYLFPGEYLVVTIDVHNLERQYLVKERTAVVPVSSMPSYPDSNGPVVLLNGQGLILDEIIYDEQWHFPLINNREGVALERIDPDNTTQQANNWHSAAATAGYGTPGYINSQYKKSGAPAARFEINPTVFSPDNDGLDDIATLSYQMPEAGYVANVTIFDASGRTVKQLVRNALMGKTGNWRWEGLNDKNQKLPLGPYIFYVEVYHVSGRTERSKHTVVLARRM